MTITLDRVIPLLLKLSDQWLPMPRWKKLQDVLAERAGRIEDFFFVQIGANDGVTHDLFHDHVTRYGWRGILVEPVRDYFDELRRLYENNTRLILENVAIAQRDEIRSLYRIREGLSHLPRWCKGMGSFYAEVLLKHKWAVPNIQDYIVKEEVRCVPFNALLARHKVRKIDLLSVDTEGHDFEIIKQIDFGKIKPAIIVYERKHLGREDQRRCIALLAGHGYCVSHRLGNTLAYLSDWPDEHQKLARQRSNG